MGLVIVKPDPAIPGSPTDGTTDGIICSQCEGMIVNSVPIIFTGMYPAGSAVAKSVKLAIRSTDSSKYENVIVTPNSAIKSQIFSFSQTGLAGINKFDGNCGVVHRTTVVNKNTSFMLNTSASAAEGAVGVEIIDTSVNLIVKYSRKI